MDNLAGKICLVTGGGSGIGLAVARAFLDEGARVAITGRQEARLRQAAESLQAADRLFFYTADVAQEEQVQELVRRVQETLGPIDILINNAGLNVRDWTFREPTTENWRLLMR